MHCADESLECSQRETLIPRHERASETFRLQQADRLKRGEGGGACLGTPPGRGGHTAAYGVFSHVKYVACESMHKTFV